MSRLLSDSPLRGLSLMVVFCLGCGVSVPSGVPPAPARVPPVSTTDAATFPPTKADTGLATVSKPLELRDMNWEQVQAFAAEHKGKVVVVDVWSTSCEPCLQEFPHLVALQQQHADDVVCVSFDCDFIGAKNKPVDYYRERVLKALTDLKAETIINLMSTVAADELFVQMDLDSIPAVYVFDREGKLSKRFDNRTPVGGGVEGISYETQINPLVADLVKAPKP
ncbi:MAG: TlpA family protein disulfide reductase [Candidatus Saccharimonas sp.]|nr:TlpA family protein disulfide reductase [Planctomycetaceae bacterium]